MIPILYDSTETSFTSNGLGRLRDCIDCKCFEERNGIYEVDFSYPVDGANYDMIQCGRIIGVTHDETGDVEPFDIVSYSKPISGVVSFHAVHISYRQRGIVANGTNINSLADAFAVLTSSAQPSNPFTYEADFTSTAYASAFDGTPRSVRQYLGGIEGSILDAYGGEYEFDRFRVILHQSRGQVRDFSIRYGVNLLDYKDDTDYSETYTSCVPYWRGNDNGQDVTVVGNRVDLGGTAYNGQNICAALDLTDKFENAPTTAELETLSLNLMRSKQTQLPAQNISVDFVRLQDMGYEGLGNLLQCNLCDSIKVEFPRYGMSGTYKIVKTVWDVLADKYDSMELGQLSTTLAEALGIQSQTDTLQSIDDLTVNDLNVTGGASVAGALTVGGSAMVDHIIEEGGTGTHDNWYYRKWASGCLECWIKKAFSSAIDTAWGSLWYKSIGTLPNYPVEFLYLPSVTGSAHVASGSAWTTFSTNNVSVTNCGTIYVISPTKATSALSIQLSVHAIGRWQ